MTDGRGRLKKRKARKAGKSGSCAPANGITFNKVSCLVKLNKSNCHCYFYERISLPAERMRRSNFRNEEMDAQVTLPFKLGRINRNL